jgi:transcription elongation factor Elf1
MVTAMSEVTCPRCRHRQQLEDRSGYTCAGCATEWMFATCDNCGRRFHMRPGTAAWTCPACGREHGSAAMVDLGGDEPSQPVALPPRHAAVPKTQRSATRGKLAAFAAVGIAAVLVLAFALSSLGAPRGSAAATSPPPSSTAPASPVDAVQALCLHLRDLQTPREDAMTRLAATLEDDAAAVGAEGKQRVSDAIERLRVGVLAYRDALAAHGDTSAAAAQIAAAIEQLPCGAGG